MKYLSITFMALLVGAEPILAQCAMCQASLANANNSSALIAGFRQGIGLMLVVMCLLGAIGWIAARRTRLQFSSRDFRKE